MLSPFKPKSTLDVGLMPQRRAQDVQPLLVGGEGPIPNPDRILRIALKVGDVWGFLACCVPDPGFAGVQLYAGVLPQSSLKGGKDRPDTLRGGDDVDVVQERKQGLAFRQQGLHIGKCWVLSKGIQSGHKGVTLFTAFRLQDLVRHTSVIIPVV